MGVTTLTMYSDKKKLYKNSGLFGQGLLLSVYFRANMNLDRGKCIDNDLKTAGKHPGAR